MHICVKPITYVTAHCHYFSVNMFSCANLLLFASRSILSCLKKLCLLNSENDHEMSQSQTGAQTKVLTLVNVKAPVVATTNWWWLISALVVA